MIYRQCPLCAHKSLKVTLFRSDLICRECVSVFRLSTRFKTFSIVVGFFVFLLFLKLSFWWLSGGAISLIGFDFIFYIVTPLLVTLSVTFLVKYFGVLSLKSGHKKRPA